MELWAFRCSESPERCSAVLSKVQRDIREMDVQLQGLDVPEVVRRRRLQTYLRGERTIGDCKHRGVRADKKGGLKMTAVSTRVEVEKLIAKYVSRLDKMPDHTPEARRERARIGEVVTDLKRILEDR